MVGLVVDFRSDPSESVEGKGIARSAWDAYSRRVNQVTVPVIEPLAGVWARKVTADLVGFWVMWHSLGGFEGLERYGMHKSTIWRKVKKFRLVTGYHPDEFKFTGITVEPEKLWDSLVDDRPESDAGK